MHVLRQALEFASSSISVGIHLCITCRPLPWASMVASISSGVGMLARYCLTSRVNSLLSFRASLDAKIDGTA